MVTAAKPVKSKKDFSNNERLKVLLEESDLTHTQALALFNQGQGRELALRTLKTYLAKEGSSTRSPCPDSVLTRFKKIL